MPWVRVIKTVKGRPYAYLQRSFRVGNSVRTESRYLGPVGGAGDVGPASSAPSRTNGLRFRFVPGARKLSADRLDREYARVRGWAEDLGVPADRFPRIALRQGKETGFRRSWFGNGLVVTFGRGDGRKAGRRAFATAIGHAFLASVREANPRGYGVISAHLDPSFRATNRLLFAALANGGEQSRLALSLQIGLFGRIHRVTGHSAASLGLPVYGKRGGWEDEAAAMIGEIATQGYRKTMDTRVVARGAAILAERDARREFERATLFDRFTGKRRALGRKLVGATAARLATEEAERKLHLLAELIPELAR